MPKRLTSKKQVEVTTELAERLKPDGRRRIRLTHGEREALQRQRLVETAVVLFTDLDNYKKWPEIAQELGITVKQLKTLVKTPEFETAYNAVMADIGHDPRYKAVAAGVVDLLPKALSTLEGLLTLAPPNVKLQAAQTVFKIANLQLQPAEDKSDREEIVEFLQKKGVDINVNVSLPAEYAEAMQKYGSEQPVEGEFKPVEQPALVARLEDHDG